MAPEHLIPLLVIPVVLVLAVLKNRRKRELKPHLLWITPTIVTALILFGMWGMTMNPNAPHVAFGSVEWAMLAAAWAWGVSPVGGAARPSPSRGSRTAS